MFNYIITAHNSAGQLEEMLANLFKCKTKRSKVFIVLDGCNDKSKEIAEKFDLTIFETPDIRETLSINYALKNVEQIGFNIILQDDVFLKDEFMEDKILILKSKLKKMGVVGMGHGCNLKKDFMTSGEIASETDLIRSEFRPMLSQLKTLKKDNFSFRQVIYKSPIVISSELYGQLGGYDERFAPIAHDDTEYCIRALKLGYINVVFAIEVDHRMELGGTRKKLGFSKYSVFYHKKHMDLLRELYPQEIKYFTNNYPSLENFKLIE